MIVTSKRGPDEWLPTFADAAPAKAWAATDEQLMPAIGGTASKRPVHGAGPVGAVEERAVAPRDGLGRRLAQLLPEILVRPTPCHVTAAGTVDTNEGAGLPLAHPDLLHDEPDRCVSALTFTSVFPRPPLRLIVEGQIGCFRRLWRR
jgi:hypothetical protein